MKTGFKFINSSLFFRSLISEGDYLFSQWFNSCDFVIKSLITAKTQIVVLLTAKTQI